MKKIQSIVLSWLVGLLLVGNTLAQHLPRHVEVIPLTANCDWGIAPGGAVASTDVVLPMTKWESPPIREIRRRWFPCARANHWCSRRGIQALNSKEP